MPPKQAQSMSESKTTSTNASANASASTNVSASTNASTNASTSVSTSVSTNASTMVTSNALSYLPSLAEVADDPTAAVIFEVGGQWFLVLPQQFAGTPTVSEPVYVILVLDRSGSMGSQMEPLKGGLATALSDFKNVNVVAFDDKVEVYEDVKTDSLPCLFIPARNGTYMQTTIPKVEELLKKIKPSREVLVVVASDGALHDPVGLPQNLKTMAARLNRSATTTVVGLRVGRSSASADTVAISAWVSALATASALHDVTDVTVDSIAAAVSDARSTLGISSTPSTNILVANAPVSRDCFSIEKRESLSVHKSEVLFVSPAKADPSTFRLDVNGKEVLTVEVVADRNVVLTTVKRLVVSTKNSMVSGGLPAESATQQLIQLEQMLNAVSDANAVWRPMSARQIATAEASLEKILRTEIAEAKNMATTLAMCSHQEMAEFIRGKQANRFAKRAKETGVEELLACVMRAAAKIKDTEDRNRQSGEPPECFLTLQSTAACISDVAEMVIEHAKALMGSATEYCFATVPELLDAAGVTGIAVRAKEGISVKADAWTLWHSIIEEIYDGECVVNGAALAQGIHAGHRIEYPATHRAMTGVVPIAFTEDEAVVLRMLRPLLATQAALFFHKVTAAVPSMVEAQIGCAVLAYVKQVGERGHATLADCTEKERDTLLRLSETFLAMCRNDVDFVEHCRDGDMLSGSGARHPNQKEFSVTPLRVLAYVVASAVTGKRDLGPPEVVTRKLYALQCYRITKRAAINSDLDRAQLLTDVLVGDCDRFLVGPLGHVLHPFLEGPTEVTVNMLQPPAEDAEFVRGEVSAVSEAWGVEHAALLEEINRVHVLLDIAPLSPCFESIVAALGSKSENERPSDNTAFVPKCRLMLAQAWLETQLKTKRKHEDFLRHRNLNHALRCAPTLDAFCDLFAGRCDGEAKMNDTMVKGLSQRTKMTCDYEGCTSNVCESLLADIWADLEICRANDVDTVLAKEKLIFFVAGRRRCDFHLEEPPIVCFGGSPWIARYETHLKPLLTAEEYERAKTFVSEGNYNRGTTNRHKHGNDHKSFFMLTGGIPPGKDFKKYPKKYSCQSLESYKSRVVGVKFFAYLLKHAKVGCCGLEHPDFNGAGRYGRAFVGGDGAVDNNTYNMLRSVLVDHTLTEEEALREVAVLGAGESN